MYANGVVSVGTTATKICTPGPTGVMIQNLGASALYLGGPTVTANTAATGGVTLPAAMAAPVRVPTGIEPGTVGDDLGLYGRVASGSVNVAFATAA